MRDSKIRFVVATRKRQSDFYTDTLLGRCLQLYKGLYELDLYDCNERGLPEVYNKSILKSDGDPAILVFAHDDVYLMNFWWCVQIRESLNSFDIVGVVGNQRRLPHQPTWLHSDQNLTVDYEYISGCVAIGDGFCIPAKLSNAGPSFREVKLLDGLLLVAHSHNLLNSGIKFDERFMYHFYDLDFCRQAEILGLKMGTWGIPVIHASTGVADEHWRAAMASYFSKWGS